MLPIAKNKKIYINTEIENVNVNTWNYPEKSISIHRYGKGDEPDWESNSSSEINDHDSSGTDFSPWNLFAVL